MKVMVNSQYVDQTRIAYREMGSGGVPKELLHDAMLIFATAEFIELLDVEYAELVRELQEDVANVGGATDEELAWLACPTLPGLMANAPSALCGVVRDHLWNDIRRLCFSDNPIVQCEYVVDEYVSIGVDASKVTIRATAYRVRPFERSGPR